MSADARGGDRPDRTDDDDEDDDQSARDPPALRVSVARYPDEPDRVTLSPAVVDDGARTTTWLSADADVVVSLADAR